MTFDVIVMTDNQGGISNQGKIPWYFSEDFAYFKNKTLYGTVIMGKNTYISIGKPLVDRINIIVSKTFSEPGQNAGYYVCKTFNEAYTLSKMFSRDTWVIGGAEIYKEALKHHALGKIYRNIVNNDFECDNKVNFLKKNINYNNVHTQVCLNRADGKEYRIDFTVGNVTHKGAEQQYLSLLQKTLDSGNLRETRSGETFSLFSNVLNFNLKHGFPLLTTKKMFWKGIVEELLFFIRGETNTKLLSEKGIKIWEGNTTREFLDSLGLSYKEGEMGPMYGYQWRFFNKPYGVETSEKGIDQLKFVIEEIKRNPQSRRLLITNFNPCQVNEGVLYPCHSIVLQFYIDGSDLSCNMYQRSVDEFLGLPFNIASTSLLLHIIAKITGLTPHMVNLHLGDCHIYKDHVEQVQTQLNRIPYKLPNILIPDFSELEEFEKTEFKDYQLLNYSCYPPIFAKMNV